jgi:hypothetical protein
MWAWCSRTYNDVGLSKSQKAPSHTTLFSSGRRGTCASV